MRVLPFLMAAFMALPLWGQQLQQNIYFVQLATYANPEYKDFSKVHSQGYLFAEMQPTGLYQVLMGTYSNYNSAKKKLDAVKAKGYKDAFIQRRAISEQDAVFIVQMATLDQNEDIYWPDWERLTTQLSLQLSDKKLRIAAGPYYSQAEADAALKTIQAKGGRQDMIVRRVSEKALHPLSNFERQKSKSYGKKTAVRSSVKSLQLALNQTGDYREKVDGQWGPNTEKSLLAFMQKDRTVQKYQLLSQDNFFKEEVEKYSLQYYLNLIDQDPVQAEAGLKQFKHPLAKVYRAYMYRNGDLVIDNADATINQLMQAAIGQVFINYHQKTRYDFSQQYAYGDIRQLIQHLRAIHEAVKDEPDVPCWFFRRHPQLAAEAFAPYWNNERDEYQISSDCGSFLSMPSMQLLLAMTQDLSGGKESKDLAQLNLLYAFPRGLEYDQMKALEAWNNRIWEQLATWRQGAPLQANSYKSLKVAYYNSLRELEDYFIQKGFSNRDARGLGLQTLQFAIGCQLDAACKG
ncbi:SPOR domain-containing protein [Saprospira sp. CCB-QB6]|uniref:SPOR domain-containing protein n=1 Tax=Saprospira sp. CCB-QB6 TaxID=3023936 RepID=UPI00234B2962|nr:SPOR domain-containing protein [Saprospira sp. CCB-QB6]WCL81227.1 SPOR domain-containing protein [Saprospira sp. CCB-QB6]